MDDTPRLPPRLSLYSMRLGSSSMPAWSCAHVPLTHSCQLPNSLLLPLFTLKSLLHATTTSVSADILSNDNSVPLSGTMHTTPHSRDEKNLSPRQSRLSIFFMPFGPTAPRTAGGHVSNGPLESPWAMPCHASRH